MNNYPSPDEQKAINEEFHKQFGFAIARWAQLEYALSRWFVQLTGMTNKMGTSVFYSSRNFNGRSEMLKAAAKQANMPDDAAAFLKEAIKKAGSYNSFRNELAHGYAIMWMPPGEAIPMIIKPENRERENNGYTTSDLASAAENFMTLSSIISGACEALKKRQPHHKSFSDYQVQVQEMPNRACPN